MGIYGGKFGLATGKRGGDRGHMEMRTRNLEWGRGRVGGGKEACGEWGEGKGFLDYNTVEAESVGSGK